MLNECLSICYFERLGQIKRPHSYSHLMFRWEATNLTKKRTLVTKEALPVLLARYQSGLKISNATQPCPEAWRRFLSRGPRTQGPSRNILVCGLSQGPVTSVQLPTVNCVHHKKSPGLKTRRWSSREHRFFLCSLQYFSTTNAITKKESRAHWIKEVHTLNCHLPDTCSFIAAFECSITALQKHKGIHQNVWQTNV